MGPLPKGLQLRGKSYYVQFKSSDGSFRLRSVGNDYAKALEAHARLRRVSATESGATFGEVCERYLKRQETFSKPKSVQCARYSCLTLLRHFRDRPVRELTPEDLSEFISVRRKRVCANSVNADLRILRAALHLTVDEEIIRELPFKVRMLRATPREIVLLSRSDVRKLLQSTADPRIRLLIALAASTGLRRQEILHLKWSDVDGDSITVRPKDGWESKTYQRRRVYVPSPVVSMLNEYRRVQRFNSDEDWLFTARSTRRRLSEVSKPLRRAFSAAGLYKRWTLLHGVRHSAASEMLLNGTDLRTLMEILGHKNLATTQRYVHTTEDAKRAAASRALV